MCEIRNSSLLGKITVVILVCCCSMSAQAKYGGGTGEPDDPYLIYTAEQMNAIGADSNDWDKHFLLCADIDLSAFTGTSFNIIGYFVNWDDNKPFTGSFDGSSHTISNFTHNSTGKWHIGIFGYVSGENAEIRNLGLIDPDVDAGTGYDVGSLVGWLDNGTVTNCCVEGGSVSGDQYVGGLVGLNMVGTIIKCYSKGSVTGDERVGGLVGQNSYGTITNCYATAGVSGDWSVGGLAGENFGIITNCYSSGSVSGTRYVGGLVGGNWFVDSKISNCYSTGSVVGEWDFGGLVGYNKGIVLASFWDIENSGQTGSDGGTGKTTAEMQMASTYIGWGCEPVWTIDEGKDYPRLVWENKPGELITVPSDLYGGGSGEPKDPYLIYTAEQLNMIGLVTCDWDKCFKLMADIDLSAFTETIFNIIGNFRGVFDGNGHKISNFIYTSIDAGSVGLFGHVDDPNAEIKNLGLISPHVDAETGGGVGSLVGWLINGTIAACYAEDAGVSGHHWVGGLVGRNGGTITNCYSTATVWGTGWDAGGLVGQNDATISNCYSTAGVSGNKYVGGLLGENCGTITDCYSEGVVSGTTNVGGLAGRNYYGIISNSYSTASVSGKTDVGGLMGRNYGDVICSFWDIETSEQATSAGGTGLPTELMQMQITFTDAGWDFVGETINGIEDIWFIPHGDYPRLWWQGMQIPMKLTPRTLNCRSYGKWVKAHLTMPEGFTVADVDADRLAVLHSFGFESAPLYVFVNEDDLVQIEAAFERQVLCSLAGDWPDELTVAGFLADGNIFLGTSKARIIAPKIK